MLQPGVKSLQPVVSWLHVVTTGCKLVARRYNRLYDVSLLKLVILEMEELDDFFKVSIKSLALFFVQFGSALDFSLHLDGLFPILHSHEW